MLKLRHTIAGATAAIALAAAGVVGLGAGSAQAYPNNCSSTGYTPNGGSYRICGSGNLVYWYVGPGRTDERIYVWAEDSCGNTWSTTWNDYSQSYMNNDSSYGHWFPCTAIEGWIQTSEASTGYTQAMWF